MSRRRLIILPIILPLLLIYIFIQQASAQTAVPHPQETSAPHLQPVISTASSNGRDKLHPQLQAALDVEGFNGFLTVLITAEPDNEIGRYLEQTLIRPRLDPAGRQLIITTLTASELFKVAADPAVNHIQLAGNPIQPPIDYEIEIFSETLSAPEIQHRLQQMQSLPRNTRSIPPEQTEQLRGWWDVGEGHHSAEAWANGYTGAGVKVMVNDSGVDFCHPDLFGTWATISDTLSPYDGWPEMFDSYSMYLYALDLNLSTTNIPNGLADYADTSATCTLGSCTYQPIAASSAHTYTLPATSQSGLYHIGSHPDTRFANLYGERIAILVVDETTSGLYDHVYMDLDHDYDFTDETAADQQMPVACLDYWNSAAGTAGSDGYNDLSGGLIYYIANGTDPIPASDWLWGGLTPANGELVAFSIVDQNQSGGTHGHTVASNIVGQGIINGNPPAVKPPYAGPGTGMIVGGGLNAKIVSNGNFYQTPYLDDAFLFSALGYDGLPGTADDIQIINNSWADSTVHNDGWDDTSRLIEEVLRLNPALTAIFSTGNGGSGYGTVVSPIPPSSLSVGSSTQFGSLGAFDSISTTVQFNWGDVIPFSNRGPGAQGTNSVDLTANGAVGSGARSLNSALDGWIAWTGWTGTSRSVPVAAGNLALVYDAYRQVHGLWPDTYTAQAILMAGAENQLSDPFVQGAGLLNALSATNIAGGLGGFFMLPGSWTAGDYQGQSYPSFANILHPGQSSSKAFSLTNTGPTAINVTLFSDQIVLSETKTITFTTQPYNTEDSSSAFRPDYLIDITNQIPIEADLMEVRLVYPFDQFDPEFNYGFNQRYRLQALNWTDLNSDGNLWTDTNANQVVNWGEIDSYEYLRFSYDYATANSHQLRIRLPLAQMDDGIFLALRHVTRSATVPTTTMTIELNFYSLTSWDWLSFDPNALLSIPPGETATFTATMTIPPNTPYGLYNGAIEAVGPNQNSLIPVVANVAADTTSFSIGGPTAPEGGTAVTPYKNNELYGNTNWSYRNESGDWRFFFLDAQTTPNTASSLIVHDDWPGPLPNDIDTLIFGPTADIYSTNDPAYYGPYTLDYLGGSDNLYINNGRYVFGTATGTTEEWVSAPLVDGLNLIAQHNVLFAGTDTSLPFTKTVGTINLSPSPIVIQACGPGGTIPITFTNSIALDGLVGGAYGLTTPDVYTNQAAQQDTPNNPSTASFTHTLTITDGGRLRIDLSPAQTSPWINDLDLYLLHDADMNGTFNWGTEIVAISAAPGVDEFIQADFPADGDYLIAVHGASVPEPPFLFDISIEAIQGTELALSTLPGGPIAVDSQIALDLDWNKTVLPGEIWKGLVVLGTPYLPGSLAAPVYVLPCDATGIIAEAAFSHNGPLPLGSTAVFTNTSTGAQPLTYLWDFGDGSPLSTAVSPIHTYTATGTYTVSLTTSNIYGNDTALQTIYIGLEVAAAFTHNGPVSVGHTATFTNTTTGTAPTTHLWDFGDSSTSTATNPTHIYTTPDTYTVTLTATNPLGSDVSTDQFVVGENAVAGFEHNGPLQAGQTAVFTNTTTGSTPLSYNWDFGDGTSVTTTNPTHIYANPGLYTVTLTATNPYGTDIATDTINVGQPVVAAFEHNGPIFLWQTAVFTNTSTGDTPLTYLWDFGDGTTSTTQNPTHTYTTPGTYTVTLTISNIYGTDIHTATIEANQGIIYTPIILKP